MPGKSMLADLGDKKKTGRSPGARNVPQFLKDVRLVYAGEVTAQTPGITIAQAALVKMFADDPGKFFDRLQREEKDYRGGKEPSSTPGGATTAAPVAKEEDPGAERAMKVLEDWLRNWRESPEAKS